MGFINKLSEDLYSWSIRVGIVKKKGFLKDDKAVSNFREIVILIVAGLLIIAVVGYLLFVKQPTIQDLFTLLGYLFALLAGKSLGGNKNAKSD